MSVSVHGGQHESVQLVSSWCAVLPRPWTARGIGPRRRCQVVITLLVQSLPLLNLLLATLVRPFDNQAESSNLYQYVTYELKTSSFRLTLIDPAATARFPLASRSDQGQLQQQSGQSAGRWKPARSIHVTEVIKSTR